MSQQAATNTDVIGLPLDRIDGRQKVTGAARYAAEFDFPNLAHAVCVPSVIANGRIAEMDTREAETSPGVLAVITYKNAPKLSQYPPPENQNRSQPSGQKSQGTTQREAQVGRAGEKLVPLQDDRIYYSGQYIAVVVAETFEQATYAASLLRVRYAEEPPVVDMERHLGSAYVAKTALGPGSPNQHRGDPDGALAQAEVRVDQHYRTPVENNNPMEMHATVAVWKGDQLTLYDATQGVDNVRHVVAGMLGIPVDNVRVISYFLGGGFGCKGFTWPHVPLAAVAAQRVGRPVKLELTRAQMFTNVGCRAQTLQRVALGATRDGRLTAMIHTGTNLTSPFDEFVERVGVATPILYACPNVRTEHKLVRVNKGTPTVMRAPGEASGCFALESAMDELAYALNMDPIALRLRNYADADPQSQQPWSSKSLRECYQASAERFGWSRRDPRPRSMRDGDLLVGWGMASATYPANRSAASAAVQIYADGSARAMSGTQDIGTGTYTIMTQVAAETLGIPVNRVHFELGDTNFPHAPGSGGSTTAASVGSAVKVAAQEARRKAIALAIADSASPLYGLTEDQIDFGNGRLFSHADPNKGEAYADLLKRHNLDRLEATGNAQPGGERKQYSMHAFGAQFAEVKVNLESGEVRVTRYVGAFAAGRILNAKTARNQCMGGIVYGLGMALSEATILDSRSGRVVNPDLAEYHVAVNADVPAIEVILLDEHDPFVNPIGVKGIGELPIVGTPAAIANAVFHATGKRIRDLPITSDKVMA